MSYRLDALRNIDSEIASRERQRELLIKDIVAHDCPHKAGEIVTIDPEEGYRISFFSGKKMKIKSIGIGFRNADKRYYWHYYGDVLRKDGTVGERYTSFSVSIKED